MGLIDLINSQLEKRDIAKAFDRDAFLYHVEDDKKTKIYLIIDLENGCALCKESDINKLKANSIYVCDNNGNKFKTTYITKTKYVHKVTIGKEEYEIACFKIQVEIVR